jgi:hypothetical protein
MNQGKKGASQDRGNPAWTGVNRSAGRGSGRTGLLGMHDSVPARPLPEFPALRKATYSLSRKQPYPLPRKQELQLFVRAYAPFDTFGNLVVRKRLIASFGGDHRSGPSTNTADTARVTYVIAVNLTSMMPNVSGKKSFCDPSHETGWASQLGGRLPGAHYDLRTGATRTATARSEEFFEPVGRPGSGSGGYIEVAAANPLVPMSPDIDLRLNIKLVKEVDRLHLVGNLAGDRFPNAESFVRDAKDKSFLLVDFRTDANPDSGPMLRLPGHGYEITSAFDVWLDINADGTLK